METPVTTRQRSRLRSVQKTPVNNDSIQIAPYVNAIEQKQDIKKIDISYDDDDEDSFPPTQAFQNVRKNGEVFWDYDASSPNTRDDLRKRLMQDDSPGQAKPKSPPRPLTPTLKFQTRPKVRSSPIVDEEGLELFNECKRLSDLAKKSETKSPNIVTKTHVDSNQNTETFKLSEPENVDDAFGDDDDGFDLLLSQIDTTEAVQSSSTFTILSKKTLHQSNGVPPKSTLELPTTSKGITPPSSVITKQDGSSAFKRHNSDNTSARQNQIRLRNNSGTVMKSWQRSQSSPVGTKKCSKEECKLNNDLKEEIERKRLAAIKRRNEKSQLKEEIERKRQAAIKRRNEKSQQ